jgi:hypothetical protein
LVISIILVLVAISFSNCTTHTRTNRSTYKAKQLPPGQAKNLWREKCQTLCTGQNNKKDLFNYINRSFDLNNILLIMMKSFLLKNIKIPTPVEIAISAILKLQKK